jgi:hypothetical protein
MIVITTSVGELFSILAVVALFIIELHYQTTTLIITGSYEALGAVLA